MVRVVLLILASFLLPLLGNALFSYLKTGAWFSKDHFTFQRLQMLFFISVLLFAFLLFVGFQRQGGDPTQGYVPARVEDGRLVKPEVSP